MAQFADHEVLRAILEQGGDPRAFERQYDEQLRAAELESIQDYILESDNLAALHQQVSDATKTCCTPGSKFSRKQPGTRCACGENLQSRCHS